MKKERISKNISVQEINFGARTKKEPPLINKNKFEIVKDRTIEGRGQHELLAEAMGKLIHKIKEGNYKNLVFLDKSARPLVAMLTDMWTHNFDADGKLLNNEEYLKQKPNINFLDIGHGTKQIVKDYFKDHLEEVSSELQKKYEQSQNNENGDKVKLKMAVEYIKEGKEKGEFRDPLQGESLEIISAIINKTEVIDKLKETMEKYPMLFKKEGDTLVIDEYSYTGMSKNIAGEVVRTGLNLKNNKSNVDVYSLNDGTRSVFGKDGNVPWKIEGEDVSLTGVIDSTNNELIATPYHKEHPEVGKKIKQLRNELHTIALNYLQSQKKEIENKSIKKITDHIKKNY